jgi:CO/xanthine dehydrogenase Mo-binding subunit
MNAMIATRREFTAGIGAIVVAFSIDPKLALTQQAAPLPGSLAQNRMLDAWIRINTDGTATIFPGKVELGQGITTALTQIAAEELDLPLGRVRVLTTDTSYSPNEGVTSGSQSIEYGGTALRLASAEVRGILLDLAAKRCRRERFPNPPAAAIATRSRSTIFRASESSITLLRRCHFEFRRCARSAHIPTCSRLSPSLMNWRAQRKLIR